MNSFMPISFWTIANIPQKKLIKKYTEFFGDKHQKIEDINTAAGLLNSVILSVKNNLLTQIKSTPTEMLFKLHYIFGEVHSLYLFEKEQRSELQNLGIDNIYDTLNENRNIMRDIIDSCNIWIENCVLFQNSNDDIIKAKDAGYKMDTNLLIDIYVYGFASRSLSLIMLSKKLDKKLAFYGLEITPNENIPAEVLKYHPVIFFNDTITGNQSILSDTVEIKRADTSPFGNGFLKEYSVNFLLFLTAIYSIQKNELMEDERSIAVIPKERFLNFVETCSKPSIHGQSFYDSFVLSQSNIQSQLGSKDDCIWKVGCNKFRYELRPFIDLGNNYVFISYAALEQAKHLWHNYCCNGGSGYTNVKDNFTTAMELRNKELANKLVDKIVDTLNEVYTPTVCEKDVLYDKIFGKRDENYGDYDIIYYVKESNELYLIESKYFSDSLNSSGLVNDYNKMFNEGGYYEHCKKRYELLLAEPNLMKKYIGVDSNINVHLLFISSKPLEIELQEDGENVTCLSLSIFKKYIKGNLISEDGTEIVRPTILI